ncbi:carboxylesterase/lipase family protein [Dyella sp.]|uniref:carboxylesterase/lipase family protein n=1 Tax=Dyella sp. TaxID=1869338 RepID=UPI002ED25852
MVTTSQGMLSGFTDENVNKYLGIRYAAAPVGELRWKAPQSAPSWSGIQAHVDEGSSCPQTPEEASFVGTASSNEDCLNLDVYTPRNSHPSATKPVMVYFYGGSFLEGSADHYDGAGLVNVGDVIVVVVNYRVGALGSLTLPGLTSESSDGISGNYGLLDQIAALHWVHDNIRAFGGDPANVTIFGQSAGGQSSLLHVSSPASNGLFEKAIIQSGIYIPYIPTLDQKSQIGDAIATALGCTSDDPAAVVACMLQLPVQSILAIQGRDDSTEGQLAWEPTAGGHALPVQPLAAIIAGQFNKVPIMLGNTHDEARLFTAEDFDLENGPLQPDDYAGALQSLFTGFPISVDQVIAQYPLSAYPDTDLAYSQVFTDATYACLGHFTAGLLTRQQVPVFEYEASDEGAAHLLGDADSYMDLGAAHTSDVPFLFPNNLRYAATQPARFTAGEAFMSYAMMRAWTAFAHTGSPFTLVSPWLRMNDRGVSFVEQLTPRGLYPQPASDFTHQHQCEFWDGVYQSVLAGAP